MRSPCVGWTAAITLVVVGAGCVSPPQWFEPAAPPTAGQGLVYVYRPGTEKSHFALPVIQVDQKDVCILAHDTYLPLYLEAGPHWITLQTTDRVSGKSTVKVDVQDGGTHYVKLHMHFAHRFIAHDREIGLEVVPAKYARSEIRWTRRIDDSAYRGEEAAATVVPAPSEP